MWERETQDRQELAPFARFSRGQNCQSLQAICPFGVALGLQRLKAKERFDLQ